MTVLMLDEEPLVIGDVSAESIPETLDIPSVYYAWFEPMVIE